MLPAPGVDGGGREKTAGLNLQQMPLKKNQCYTAGSKELDSGPWMICDVPSFLGLGVGRQSYSNFWLLL